MKFNKSFLLIVILLVIVIAGVIGGVMYFKGKSSNTPEKVSPTTNNNSGQKSNNEPPVTLSSSHCGLIIDGPAANSTTAFPLTIHGAIDNNNSSTLGCSWTMFEGQAGTAQIYYWNQGNNSWQAVNTPFIIPVSNWQTLGPVPFVVTVNFNNGGIGLVSGNLMKITFTEENPSGEGTVDTLDLPLVLQ